MFKCSNVQKFKSSKVQKFKCSNIQMFTCQMSIRLNFSQSVPLEFLRSFLGAKWPSRKKDTFLMRGTKWPFGKHWVAANAENCWRGVGGGKPKADQLCLELTKCLGVLVPPPHVTMVMNWWGLNLIAMSGWCWIWRNWSCFSCSSTSRVFAKTPDKVFWSHLC